MQCAIILPRNICYRCLRPLVRERRAVRRNACMRRTPTASSAWTLGVSINAASVGARIFGAGGSQPVGQVVCAFRSEWKLGFPKRLTTMSRVVLPFWNSASCALLMRGARAAAGAACYNKCQCSKQNDAHDFSVLMMLTKLVIRQVPLRCCGLSCGR